MFLFLTIIFKTPIPPWPEEGGGGGGNGLEINLGTGNDGIAPNQYAQISMPSFESKKVVQAVVPDQQEEIKAKPSDAEDVMTQDAEDAPTMEAKPATSGKSTAASCGC